MASVTSCNSPASFPLFLLCLYNIGCIPDLLETSISERLCLQQPWKPFSSVQSLICVNSLRPHESQHTRPPCPSLTPGVHSNSCPSSRWCHPAISSSVILFSSCPQSLPASESFPMSQFFSWGGRSIGV